MELTVVVLLLLLSSDVDRVSDWFLLVCYMNEMECLTPDFFFF